MQHYRYFSLMKKIVLFLLSCCFLQINAQENPFATMQFKTAFLKIYNDAAAGFPTQKGTIKNNELGGVITQYRVNTLLPGADSGQVNLPLIGFCNSHYTFKPYKTKEDAEIKRQQLAEAIEKALASTLYSKETVSTAKQFTFYNKYYFKKAGQTDAYYADFGTSIVLEKGKYFLTLDIKGNCNEEPKPEKKAALIENDLEAKLLRFYNDAYNNFTTSEGAVTRSNSSYTYYKSIENLFGQSGEVEDGKYAVKLTYNYGFTLFNSMAEAEDLYGKLKMALQTSLSGKMNFSAEQQSKYGVYNSSIQGLEIGKSFIQSKLQISLTIHREEKYPAVYLRFDKQK